MRFDLRTALRSRSNGRAPSVYPLLAMTYLSGCFLSQDYVPTSESLASEHNLARAFVVEGATLEGRYGNTDANCEIFVVHFPEEIDYSSTVTQQAADAGWSVSESESVDGVRCWTRSVKNANWLSAFTLRVAVFDELNTAVVGWVNVDSSLDAKSQWSAESEFGEAESEFGENVLWPRFRAVVAEYSH